MTKIREARKKAGLTQQAMSDALGIPKRTIEDWEGERRTPPEWAERLVIQELERLSKTDKQNAKIVGGYKNG